MSFLDSLETIEGLAAAAANIDTSKLFIEVQPQMTLYEPNLYEKLLPLQCITHSSGLILYFLDYESTYICFRQDAHNLQRLVNIPIGLNGDLCGVVAYEKKDYLIEDTVKFQQQHKKINLGMNVLKNCIYCFPILNTKSAVVAVIEICRNDGGVYSENDCKYMLEFSKWFGLALEQARKSVIQNNKLQIDEVFYDQLYQYFSRQVKTYENYLSLLCKACMEIIKPQNIFYYDLLETSSDKVPIATLSILRNNALREILHRINMNQAARFGSELIRKKIKLANVIINDEKRELINKTFLQNAESTEKLYNMLWVAIRTDEKCMGILCFTNSKRGETFTTGDETFICSLINFIISANYYRKVLSDLEIGNAIIQCSSEKLRYQLCKSLRIADKIVVISDESIPPNFFEFSWQSPSTESLLSYTYFLFMNICPNYFDNEKLKTFLLTIKNNHRNLYYHNFSQTFFQIRTLYLIIKKSKILELSEEEIVPMMLFSLTRYVNYYGLDNETLHLLNHPLKKMVNKMYVENNALLLSLSLIEKTELFDHLSGDVSNRIIKNYTKFFRDPSNIYSNIFKNKIERLIQTNNLNYNNMQHRNYIKSLIFYCTLMFRFLLPYAVATKLGENFYKEKHAIGDIQKKFNLKKIIAQEYDKNFFHKIRQFEYENVERDVLPMFKLLVFLIPECREMLELASGLRNAFRIQLTTKDKKLWSIDDSYDSIPEFDNIDAGNPEEFKIDDRTKLL